MTTRPGSRAEARGNLWYRVCRWWQGRGARRAAGYDAARIAPPRTCGRRLDQLEPGECSVIQRLEGNSALERRLMELGLVPGTAVEVVRRAPFGDPVEVRICDVNLALRRSETSRIHVSAS